MEEVATIPSRCHWHGCEQHTSMALLLELIPPGSMVARPARRVPLCDSHRMHAKATGRVNLGYHPDNTQPVNAEDRPYEENPDEPLEEKTGKPPEAVELYRDEKGETRVRRELR